MSAEEMREPILRSAVRFAPEWLALCDKVVAPLPMSGDDTSAIAGYANACRRAGYTAVLAVPMNTEGSPKQELSLPAPGHELSWAGAVAWPCLLTPSDRACALLVTGRGYGLLAGTREFLALVLPHGLDIARVDFARYARRVRTHRDELIAAAGEFPGRQVSATTPVDLDPAAGAGRQVRLMGEFTAGRLDGPAFLTGWMDARRASQMSGERLSDALVTVLEHTFSTLERYEAAPELAEPENLTEAELRHAVGELLLSMDRL